jgi:HNH endonuclease
MTERPIIFTGPMVRAILEGRKTQTRRVLKPQPSREAEGLEIQVAAPTAIGVKPGTWFYRELLPGAISAGTVLRYQPGDLLVPALNAPGLDDRYCVDIYGRAWSCAKGEWRKMKASPNSKGYLTITPSANRTYRTRFLHRLVCEAFYGPAQAGRSQVRHLDGDQLNNAPENLDWGTQEQNWTDRAAHGRGMGESHHAAKLTRAQVADIRKRGGAESQRALARHYGVSQSQIWSVLNNKTWGGLVVADPPNMPRWASRLTLRVTDVRVQRLQEISEEDARAEGADKVHLEDPEHTRATHRKGFELLWGSIHGKGAWAKNPWVVAITFERVQP